MNDEDLVKLAELSVTTLSAEEETLLANWLENETGGSPDEDAL